MTTVALIGADGAGKTTVARRLEQGGRLPIKYVYLGVSATASNHLLPSTRLWRWIKKRGGATEYHGPPDAAAAPGDIGADGAIRRSSGASLKALLKLSNRVADEWYRQAVAAWYQRRGQIVLFDRHYLADFSAHDMDSSVRLPFERRLHGWMLRRFYPTPDLVVLLDAPPATLLARKGEGSIEALERRRGDYFRAGRSAPRFAVVDATRTIDEVVLAVEVEMRALVGSQAAR